MSNGLQNLSNSMKNHAAPHLKPVCKPIPASETISMLIGLEPMQYSRRRAMVWCKLAREGLFS